MITLGKKQKILMIDDDADIREMFTAALKAAGFEMFEADRGEAGIKKAKEVKPDLVLMDIKMPDMTGIETLSKMKEDPDLAHLKVTFMTNFGEPTEDTRWVDRKYAAEVGALDFIKKTDDLPVIVAHIKNILSGKDEH